MHLLLDQYLALQSDFYPSIPRTFPSTHSDSPLINTNYFRHSLSQHNKIYNISANIPDQEYHQYYNSLYTSARNARLFLSLRSTCSTIFAITTSSSTNVSSSNPFTLVVLITALAPRLQSQGLTQNGKKLQKAEKCQPRVVAVFQSRLLD